MAACDPVIREAKVAAAADVFACDSVSLAADRRPRS